jgi:pseudouridine-5'-phosphate glycosidase
VNDLVHFLLNAPALHWFFNPRPHVDSLQDAKIQETCEEIHLNVSDSRQSGDEDPVLLGKVDKKTALKLLRDQCGLVRNLF